jgi:ubiquinol-cytochrome c reductase cytochrome c subunit
MRRRSRRGAVATGITGAFLALYLCAVAASAQAPAQPAAPPAGNAEKGKEIYKKVGCYECHGLEAQGGPGTGPRLGPNPIPYQRFASYLRAPTGNMPPYRVQVLPDQAVADLHAFLRSVPRPPALSSIPLLAPSQFGVK